MKFFKFTLSIAFIITISWITAYTFWVDDPTVNVPICVSESYSGLVKGVEDQQGGSILVWDNLFPDESEELSGLYVQHIDSSGEILWQENGISLTPGYYLNTWNYEIIPDNDGGAIVAFMDNRSLFSWDIYAQRLDAAGNMLWGDTGVPVICAPGEQNYL